jgi:hypothetical protein
LGFQEHQEAVAFEAKTDSDALREQVETPDTKIVYLTEEELELRSTSQKQETTNSSVKTNLKTLKGS